MMIMMVVVVLQLLCSLEHVWTLSHDDYDDDGGGGGGGGAPVTLHFGTCLDTYS